MHFNDLMKRLLAVKMPGSRKQAYHVVWKAMASHVIH